MNKREIKVIVLITLTTLILNTSTVLATSNSTIQDQINSNNNEINNLEEEKNKANDQSRSAKSDLKKILDAVSLKGIELDKSNQNVDSYQSKIDALQYQINSVQNQINQMDVEIKHKEKIIVLKEEEMADREEMLGGRLRNYYKNGFSSQIMSIVFSSDGLGSLISNIFNLNKIVNMDNQLLDEVKKMQEQLEEDKVILKEEMDKLNEEKEAIRNKQADLVQAQKQYVEEQKKVQQQMNELKRLENQKQSIFNSLLAQEKELEGKIGDLTAYNEALEEEMKKIFDDINNGSNVDGSISQGEKFIRPNKGYISSAYGSRTHPVTGEQKFHTGVDFAGGNNSSIVASKSGKVVTATYHSSYGNYVIIDHGGGVQTLYAHANTLLVSVGQQVSQGQKIALVGSTGMSTGPHLHFEVRINGKHTNPMNYL